MSLTVRKSQEEMRCKDNTNYQQVGQKIAILSYFILLDPIGSQGILEILCQLVLLLSNTNWQRIPRMPWDPIGSNKIKKILSDLIKKKKK